MITSILLLTVFSIDSGVVSQWRESSNYLYLDNLTGEDTGIVLWWSIANVQQKRSYFYAVSDQGNSEIAGVRGRSPYAVRYPEILSYEEWSRYCGLNDLIVIHNTEKHTYALFKINDVYQAVDGQIYTDITWYWNSGSGDFRSSQPQFGPQVGKVQEWVESGMEFDFDQVNTNQSGIQVWWSINTLDPPRCFLYASGEFNLLAQLPKGVDPQIGVDIQNLNWVEWASEPVEMGDWVLFSDRLSGAYAAVQIQDIYGDFSGAHTQYLDCTWFYNDGISDFQSLSIDMTQAVPSLTHRENLDLNCTVFGQDLVERVWFEVNDLYEGEAEWEDGWHGRVPLFIGKNRVRVWAQNHNGLVGSWYQTIERGEVLNRETVHRSANSRISP